MAKLAIITEGGVFDTLDKASEALGVSAVTVSRWLKAGDKGVRWGERVYALELKDGSWTVATMSMDNKGYMPLDWKGKKIPASAVKQAKDITWSWYGKR